MADKRTLGLLTLLSQIIVVFGDPSLSNSVMECITPSCKSTATSLLLSMNKEAHPCVDFYEYACGNWRKKNPLPPNMHEWNQLYMRDLETQMQIADTLKRPITANDIVAVQKAKLSYQTCMDEGKIDNRGSEGIEAILNSNGGWPLMMSVGTWIEGEFPWQIINNNYMTYFGAFGLFNVDVASDEVVPDQYRITLTKPTQFRLPLTKTVSLKDNKRLMKSYLRYISSTVLAMNGFQKDVGFRKRLLKNIRDMINFEIRLAEITAGLNEVVQSVPNLLTIDRLQEMYNNANLCKSTSRITWLQTIKSIFIELPDIKIDGNEQILLKDEIFFEQLANLLDKTPEEIIVNYIHWKLVDSAIMFTSREIRGNLDELYRCLGINYSKTREQLCQTETGMEHALGYAYVKRHFSDSSTIKIWNMKTRIQKKMEEKIGETSWLDDNTKSLAKDKLNHMESLIGYPNWYTDKGVNSYYENFEVGISLISNWLNRQRFKLTERRRLLRTVTNEPRWQIPPTIFNTYYSRTANAMTIPASMLQMPFFDAERPEVFNYATIGAIIGHEITHGFDMDGCQFDKYGNRNQWCDHAVFKEYRNKAQCFVDKFSKYIIYRSPYETIYTDGKKTLNENIADATGYELAYAAYKHWAEKNRSHDDLTLEGLESFSNDQLFFLSLANIGCSIESIGFLKNIAPTLKHSIARSRLNGALSNMKSFSQAFNCPLGFLMNPIQKCKIWG